MPTRFPTGSFRYGRSQTARTGAARYFEQAGYALAANTLLAVLLGGVVPLALHGMRMDPALSSGPILTTVTDMCGFFLVLSLAAAALGHLTL